MGKGSVLVNATIEREKKKIIYCYINTKGEVLKNI